LECEVNVMTLGEYTEELIPVMGVARLYQEHILSPLPRHNDKVVV
jgi:hypothetical protein